MTVNNQIPDELQAFTLRQRHNSFPVLGYIFFKYFGHFVCNASTCIPVFSIP